MARRAARGDEVAGARETFLAEVTRGSDFTDAEIALHEAGALFRLAPGSFRRLEADWLEGIDRILALAETRLADVPAPSPLRSGGDATPDLGLTDPALPQLGTLQDPIAMSARLTAAFDDRSVSVAAIDVVRHKPGRRAILCYEVYRNGHRGSDGTAPRDWLYGKTHDDACVSSA